MLHRLPGDRSKLNMSMYPAELMTHNSEPVLSALIIVNEILDGKLKYTHYYDNIRSARIKNRIDLIVEICKVLCLMGDDL